MGHATFVVYRFFYLYEFLLSIFSELKEQVWFCRSSLEVLLGQLEGAWVLLEHKHRLVDAAMAQQQQDLFEEQEAISIKQADPLKQQEALQKLEDDFEQKIEDVAVPAAKARAIEVLNVGGEKSPVSKHTLMAEPDTLFTTMLSMHPDQEMPFPSDSWTEG